MGGSQAGDLMLREELRATLWDKEISYILSSQRNND